MYIYYNYIYIYIYISSNFCHDPVYNFNTVPFFVGFFLNKILPLKNTIQNNVSKIVEKVIIFEEKIQHLSSKLITREKNFK